METKFANVLLPLPLPGYFTYHVPGDFREMIAPGKRVVVPFGKKKIYTALVHEVLEENPSSFEPKSILSVIDDRPVVFPVQFRFWEWMASYYMCTPGEVMNAALPSGFKLASESMVCLNPEADLETADLNEKEIMIVEALLSQKKLPVNAIADLLDQRKIIPIIHTLIDKGVVVAEEKLEEKYKPLRQTFIRLGKEYEDEEKLKAIFDELSKRAFKQLQALMVFLSLTREASVKAMDVRKSDLLKNKDVTQQALTALINKGILEYFEIEASRLAASTALNDPGDIALSLHQKRAFSDIGRIFAEKEVILLHGITSSGKTELYIKLIDQALNERKQVLYLLPEIALTSQIINRLQRYFGDNVGVYHSKYNDNERVEIWNHCLHHEKDFEKGRFQVILGARSALFLPYHNLGLIIVDEEHDSSYKQYDPAPRYHARDAAIMLARLHGAKTLLGSATPAIESYFNASNGKYGLVEMTERFGGVSLPEIVLANVREETRNKTMQSHFTSALINRIRDALALKEQVILFQNRRGFSLHLTCDSCDWVPMCKNCDISLTYHKRENKIKCHYCGYSEALPQECPQCKSTRILMKGFGTEKVEEELGAIFPEATIRRMDLDSTRTKYAHQRLISDFEERRTDILVGTQMVTKGLDFDNVSLVGILNADNMLNFPDFRSHERSFQLMEQVSGRAGRKAKQGQVIIQSYNPQHAIIQHVVHHDYHAFYRSQLTDRHKFQYPPFNRLIILKVKHRDYNVLNKAASDLAHDLRVDLGKRILGPEYPLVSKIQNWYIKHIMVKIERGNNIAEMKKIILNRIENTGRIPAYRQVRVVIDVDPV
ncbi:MAG TPA: primosomal protein N' [Bacteroidales bacterium]|nr:primosomal protein N' [Bacteroidales bacterium]HPM92695.1 primosomal protein N' [Bacteroidales bacterium]